MRGAQRCWKLQRVNKLFDAEVSMLIEGAKATKEANVMMRLRQCMQEIIKYRWRYKAGERPDPVH